MVPYLALAHTKEDLLGIHPLELRSHSVDHGLIDVLLVHAEVNHRNDGRNHDAVTAVFRESGLYLQYASEKLKADPELVKIAVGQKGLHSSFSSESDEEDHSDDNYEFDDEERTVCQECYHRVPASCMMHGLCDGCRS